MDLKGLPPLPSRRSVIQKMAAAKNEVLSWGRNRGGGNSLDQHVPFEEQARMHQQRFDQLLQKSNTVLLEVSAVFPFDFFPNVVRLDLNAVHIRIREFFASEIKHSILYPDITDTSIENGPLFSTFRIYERDNNPHPIVISYLRKKDALRLRCLVQGLMLVARQNIDIGHVTDTDLVEKLEALGRQQIGL